LFEQDGGWRFRRALRQDTFWEEFSAHSTLRSIPLEA
jgi:hypothetical protein